MTKDLFIDLHYKYQPWFGKPVEISTSNSLLNEPNYKKFLLIDINSEFEKEVDGEEIVSLPYVVIKDLVNFQVHNISLVTFDQTVRLINLGGSKTLKLSNTNKIGNIKVDNFLEYIEFFTIQINSHFGKSSLQWKNIASKIAISFNAQRTFQSPISITDKLILSSLITNQVQPVFNLLKTYLFEQRSINSQIDDFDKIEVIIEELSPVNEDYELTFMFEKRM
jgi:hypothetical protein